MSQTSSRHTQFIELNKLIFNVTLIIWYIFPFAYIWFVLFLSWQLSDSDSWIKVRVRGSSIWLSAVWRKVIRFWRQHTNSSLTSLRWLFTWEFPNTGWVIACLSCSYLSAHARSAHSQMSSCTTTQGTGLNRYGDYQSKQISRHPLKWSVCLQQSLLCTTQWNAVKNTKKGV